MTARSSPRGRRPARRARTTSRRRPSAHARQRPADHRRADLPGRPLVTRVAGAAQRRRRRAGRLGRRDGPGRARAVRGHRALRRDRARRGHRAARRVAPRRSRLGRHVRRRRRPGARGSRRRSSCSPRSSHRPTFPDRGGRAAPRRAPQRPPPGAAPIRAVARRRRSSTRSTRRLAVSPAGRRHAARRSQRLDAAIASRAPTSGASIPRAATLDRRPATSTGRDVRSHRRATCSAPGSRPGGAQPPAPIVATPARRANVSALVHRPGSVQTEIRIGHVGLPRRIHDFPPLSVMGAILGGLFNSRLNMKLREEKGYTYGASAGWDLRRGAGPVRGARRGERRGRRRRPSRHPRRSSSGSARSVSRRVELRAARDFLDRRLPAPVRDRRAPCVGALGGLAVHGLPDEELDALPRADRGRHDRGRSAHGATANRVRSACDRARRRCRQDRQRTRGGQLRPDDGRARRRADHDAARRRASRINSVRWTRTSRRSSCRSMTTRSRSRRRTRTTATRPETKPDEPDPDQTGRDFPPDEASLGRWRRLPALASPAYRWFLFGAILSNIGSWMQATAQGWLVLGLTNSAALLGVTSAAANLPTLILSLYAGVLADRVDQRRLLVLTQIARGRVHRDPGAPHDARCRPVLARDRDRVPRRLLPGALVAGLPVARVDPRPAARARQRHRPQQRAVQLLAHRRARVSRGSASHSAASRCRSGRTRSAS